MKNQPIASVPYAPQQIVQARKKKGYSQEELAFAASLSLRTIQRIEKGNVQPRLYSLRALAEALDCELENFETAPAVPSQSSEQMEAWMKLAIYSVVVLPFLPLLLQGVLYYRATERTEEEAYRCRQLLHFQVRWLAGLVMTLLVQPLLMKLLTGQASYGDFPLGLLTYILFVGGNLASTLILEAKSGPQAAMT